MSDEKLDKIMQDLAVIKTTLLPPGQEPPLAALDRRVGSLESARSWILGGWAVLVALFTGYETIKK